MKDSKYLLILLLPLFLFSCKSTEVTVTETEEIKTVETVKEETEEPIEEPVIEETIEEVIEEKTEKIDEPEDEVLVVDEVITEPAEEDEEYLRSTNALSSEESVSKEEFEMDKAEILEIIAELTEIMERNDVKAWLTYISPESVTYYSNPANIRKAQKKLPDKTIQLHGIGDYFKYVFIPARKRSNVDEIRYISKTNVKAVQVKADNSIVVYYYFQKINGKWMVHIPPLS